MAITMRPPFCKASERVHHSAYHCNGIEQYLDNLRRKDSLRGAETAEISVRLGNDSASHFEGSAIGVHATEQKSLTRSLGFPISTEKFYTVDDRSSHATK